MSATTHIEWTDSTFNYWEGCQKAGPGCDHCYAEVRNARFAGIKIENVSVAPNWGPGAPRRLTSEKNRNLPYRWNARRFLRCTSCGHRYEGEAPEVFASYCCPKCDRETFEDVRRRVFCSSLSDVFDNAVDPAWRADLFAIMEATPNLDWLVLTKRVGNVRKMVPARWLEPGGWPAHVRIGATVVNQEEADRDILKLLALPCPNFLSIEPLLGAIDLERPMPGPDLDQGGGASICQPWMIQSGIDWVIVGGETGPGARPMHPDWVRSLRDQCEAAGVSFLFKQWGDWASEVCTSHRGEPDTYLHVDGRTATEAEAIADGGEWLGMFRLGKKLTGRHLDGRTWDGFPA